MSFVVRPDKGASFHDDKTLFRYQLSKNDEIKLLIAVMGTKLYFVVKL